MRDFMMKDDEVERKIRLGEDSSLELKDVRVSGSRVAEPNASDIADEFAAAANSQGCTFLFGVDDRTRAVTGIDADKLDNLTHHMTEVLTEAGRTRFLDRRGEGVPIIMSVMKDLIVADIGR